MPNKNTFSIKPVKEIISKYKSGFTIDPFANNSKLADLTNDINPEYNTNFHLDALDFLKQIQDSTVDTVLFDPPFSPTQSKTKYGTNSNLQTNKRYWTLLKKEIQRIIKPNGIAISCAWNSGGIGKKYGFELVEIVLINHGGGRNDTIVTVERSNK
jgi:tRNA1(Val) A37 N6-methylase TrmN6